MTDLVDDNSNNPAPAGTVTPVATPTIDPPVAMTPVSAGDISAPNNLARVASGSIGVPTTFTPVGAGAISTPNALARVSAGDISAPNTLTGVTAGDISAPNTLNRIAAGSVATPNTLVPVAAQHIPRSIKPLLSLDFASGTYSKNGTAQNLTDIVTYSRASSASYVESFINGLGQKEKRITTVGANVARIEDEGLLIEGTSTNINTHSESLNAATGGYILENVAGVDNNILAPDQTLTATKFTDDATNAQHRLLKVRTVTSGQPITVSIFAKAGSKSRVGFNSTTTGGTSSNSSIFDLFTGQIVSGDNGSIEDAGDGWYRISHTYTTTSTTFTAQFSLIEGVDFVYSGVGGFLYLWGAQIEALPLATSYIKTEGSAVSRAADIASASISIESNDFTLSSESRYKPGSQIANGNRFVYSLNDNTQSNRILCYNLGGGNSRHLLTDSLSAQTIGAAQSSDESIKNALSASGGVLSAYLNSELNASSAQSVYPVGVSKLSIGCSALNTAQLYGNIKRINVYNKALTANEVKAL